MTYIHPGLDNTAPMPSVCAKCSAPVWHAVVDGGAVNLDPTHLNISGELLARLSGRATVQDAPAGKLAWRSVHHIRHDSSRFVLAAHICTPAPHPPLTDLWPTPAPKTDPEGIPF